MTAAMTEEEIVCILHKKEATAIICGHLLAVEDGHIGFHVPEDIKNDLEAWCDTCEKILNEAGGWTDSAVKFADFRSCCVGCFISLKKRSGF